MDKEFLLRYMPDYYNGVYEMEELLKAQGVSLSEFDRRIEKTLLNQFIAKADEKGIAIFENEAGIKPNPSDSLEVRRNNVLLRLLPPKPLTIRYLNHLLKIMGLKVTASVNYGERTVYVEADQNDLTNDQITSIKYMLNITLPVTMIYVIKINLSSVELKKDLYVGVANIFGSTITVGANHDQLDFKTELKSEFYIGIGSAMSSDIEIKANRKGGM